MRRSGVTEERRVWKKPKDYEDEGSIWSLFSCGIKSWRNHKKLRVYVCARAFTFVALQRGDYGVRLPLQLQHGDLSREVAHKGVLRLVVVSEHRVRAPTVISCSCLQSADHCSRRILQAGGPGGEAVPPQHAATLCAHPAQALVMAGAHQPLALQGENQGRHAVLVGCNDKIELQNCS